jgi:starch synthase (maltosyl-transferring)
MLILLLNQCMIPFAGKKRIVITRIGPQVEGGKYPAKAVVGDEVVISASIFTDGHDEIGACALIRQKPEKQWKELPMKLVDNDCWQAAFHPDKPGHYSFQVLGWIDHYTTWQKGLLKKNAAAQDISVELQIGRKLIADTAARAAAKDKVALTRYLERLDEGIAGSDTLQICSEDVLLTLMHRNRNKAMVTTYPQVFDVEVEVKRASFSSWYELFPRSAATEPGRHGTFRDVIRLLPRIEAMGFDTLYMPPIHPIGELKRKGKNNSLNATTEDPGSPWAIGSRLGGHKAIHPELGSLADFQALVKEARKRNIEVALDIAFQCAPDHPYVKEHPQWFNWRPDGTVQYAENPPKKYEDILPFNFETDDWEALWQELKSVILYWIEQGVKVFRVDNPHTKSLAFWEWAINEVRGQYPETIFLAEAFTRPRIMEHLAKTGFNQSYTYFTWRNTREELQEYLTELTTTELRYYFRPNFWPNTPDILPPELTAGGETAHIIRLILAATMSSSYGVYGPVYEYAMTEPMPGKEEYIDNEKYEIRHWKWDEYTRIGEIMTRLNRIRKTNAALHATNNIVFAETTNDQIICYCKSDKQTGNLLVIVVNLDPMNTHAAEVKLPLKKLGLLPGVPYKAADLLSGDTFYWQESWNYVELRPYEMPAHILHITQEKQPDNNGIRYEN